MKAEMLRSILDASIAEDYDDGREYLGMSQIGQCPRKLYDDMILGRARMPMDTTRRCHEGQLHERDLLDRLSSQGLTVANRGRELIAPFDPRFRGHIDGELDGDLLEIKSVEDMEQIERVRRDGARSQHRQQVQAYMLYGDYDRALIVYKSRASGDIWVVYEMRDKGIGRALERKARMVLASIDARRPPLCECGRCRR